MEKFKISAVIWDSDKDPSGFTKWVDSLSALVRATEHGNPLEDFLDMKLQRNIKTKVTVQSGLPMDPRSHRTPLHSNSNSTVQNITES